MNREDLEREMLAQPVRSLQYMLRRLSLVYPFLPEIVADGIFGELTLEAVMLFQREFGLPVTGVVDRDTWNAIRDLWYKAEERLASPKAARLFPGERVSVEPGENREFMIVPQTMLQVLSRQFSGITPDVADGIYGPESVENAKWLQRAGGLPQTGIMDHMTWDVLARLYELFVVKDLERESQEFTEGWG